MKKEREEIESESSSEEQVWLDRCTMEARERERERGSRSWLDKQSNVNERWIRVKFLNQHKHKNFLISSLFKDILVTTFQSLTLPFITSWITLLILSLSFFFFLSLSPSFSSFSLSLSLSLLFLLSPSLKIPLLVARCVVVVVAAAAASATFDTSRQEEGIKEGEEEKRGKKSS